MEPIKIELVISESFLTQLDEHIKKSVAEALAQNVESIKSEQTKLTREEACKMLKISLPTLSKHIKDETIRAQRIGRRVLIPISEIENYLKKSA